MTGAGKADRADVETIVRAVLRELGHDSDASKPAFTTETTAATPGDDGVMNLPDPTDESERREIGVKQPHDADGLRNLRSITSARLGVGRAGPRPRTKSLLLFQADHAMSKDAIYSVVPEEVKQQVGLFTVSTQVADREEYLLRPELGRRLSSEARQTITERCTKSPDVQICVGDGLSAAAIESNLAEIYPVIEQGLKSAGLTVGTPFFIENCRVGVMNDVNTVVDAKVVLLLIGERPGLGIADAMSAYMGYRPEPGKTDAERDLICMITVHGGTNPLEAGAYVVEMIQNTLKHSASGVELRELSSRSG